MRTMIFLAGLGQLALGAAGLAIPRVLRWREETARLTPLTREVFWTYAAYIFGTNALMGVLSAAAPERLLDGTLLAAAVTGYIALYWGGRIGVQFLYFSRPPGLRYVVAETALLALFAYLTSVYGIALAFNLGWLP